MTPEMASQSTFRFGFVRLPGRRLEPPSLCPMRQTAGANRSATRGSHCGGRGGRRQGPRGGLTRLGGYGGVVGQCSDLSALCVAPANVGIDRQLVSNNEVLFPRTRVTSRSRPRSIGTDMFVAFVKLPPIAKQTVTFRPRVQGLKVVIASLAVFGSIFGCVNSNPRSKRGWASKRPSPERGSIS